MKVSIGVLGKRELIYYSIILRKCGERRRRKVKEIERVRRRKMGEGGEGRGIENKKKSGRMKERGREVEKMKKNLKIKF